MSVQNNRVACPSLLWIMKILCTSCCTIQWCCWVFLVNNWSVCCSCCKCLHLSAVISYWWALFSVVSPCHIHHSQCETQRHSKVKQWGIETERYDCREDYQKKKDCKILKMETLTQEGLTAAKLIKGMTHTKTSSIYSFPCSDCGKKYWDHSFLFSYHSSWQCCL